MFSHLLSFHWTPVFSSYDGIGKFPLVGIIMAEAGATSPPRHRKTKGHSVRIFLIVFSSICGYVFVKHHIVMNIYKTREAYITYDKIFSSSDQMFTLGLLN